MKVIFSRKGFDDENGEMPSPIIDNHPISLPIPYDNSSITFEDRGLGQIVEDLSKNKKGKIKISKSQTCHPDPDLDMGAFGQVDSAQSHLKNQGVGKGDLFLFFGTFREAELNGNNYEWITDSPEHHRIFGWLFVEGVIPVGFDPRSFRSNHPEYANHPHAQGNWGDNNTIYIGQKTFIPFNRRTVKGFGKFKATNETLLTAPSSNKSIWQIPDWLNEMKGGCGMTYNKTDQYSDDTVKTAAKGQEFVSKPNQTKDFEDWLINLFDAST